MSVPRGEQQSLSEALDWLIELREVLDDDPRHSHWQAWLAASGQNREAWQRVEALGQRLSGAQGRLLLHSLQATPVHASRRAFVGKLCLLFAGTGVLAYSGQRLAWPELGTDYHTRTGELRQLTLDNHLQLALNTATALDISHDREGTRIALLKGEIMVDSRQVMAESTQVQLPQARLWAGQARFAVRALEGDLQRVCVYQGQLSVIHGTLEQRLEGGQQLLFSGNESRRQELPLASDAWTRGLLISDGMPLAEFTRELDRYRSGRLYCDPKVAELRVSGVFDLKNPEQVLATLSQVLPVKMQYRTRYWATLVPVA
ncbi:FecR domain-containing protein [Pseudomonas rubra]|uniref:FecR domain-containing protein n=1 Tax=Pseudomonas rubra TaxID=2942627 RepID=A0ABT5P5T6_9PSED|nr:FecR domain-containing protein [Pseudomonas rubra]MDD1013665.1 FecR domain-containing protein [Pseudomonas rubra]MDD1040016.1 FecR domain-containing protein [Pseudomonas rubra]MDD1155978.1 FecR domain-containing protein [Pseudomonas rubra]